MCVGAFTRIVFYSVIIRFPDDVDLHLIMKNQFTPMNHRFQPPANEHRLDKIVECLIELYKNVS